MGKYSDMLVEEPATPKKNKYSSSVWKEDFTNVPMVLKGQGEFLPNMKAAMVDDPETKLRIFAESQGLSPDNVGFRNGEVVARKYRDPNMLAALDSGGAATAGKILSHAPEAIGGTVGAIGGGVPGAMLGAAAGIAGKKIYANTVLGEPQDWTDNVKDMAFEAIFEGIFGLGGKALNKARELRKVEDIAKLDMPRLEAKRMVLKQSTGMDLDLAQLSNSPTLKSWKRFVTNMPGESSEIMVAFSDLQKGQTGGAIAKLADALSPTTLAKAQGQHGINAAKEVINLAKEARATAVKPFYDAADKIVLSGDVVEQLAKDPVLAATLRRVKATPAYRKELEGYSDQSLKAWHTVMQNLGDQIGKNANQPKLKRILTQTQNDLRVALEAASPEFKLAQDFYAKQTKQLIEPLQNSIIGVLSEIPDAQARSASKALFDGAFPDVDGIRSARSAFMKLEKSNPQYAGSWNGLVRQWLHGNLAAASKVSQTGEVQNLAGKVFQRIAGSPHQKAALREAIGPQAEPLMKDVLEALEYAARTPTQSSQTTFNQLAKEQLQASTLRNTLGTIRRPIDTAIAATDQSMLERHAADVAEALTDPTKRELLLNLRKLTDVEKRRTIMYAVITGHSLGAAGGVILGE